MHCAVDSGFGEIEKDLIVKSLHDNLSSNEKTHKEARDDVRMNQAATSMWQWEWGMRGFQASCLRIKNCLGYEVWRAWWETIHYENLFIVVWFGENQSDAMVG